MHFLGYYWFLPSSYFSSEIEADDISCRNTLGIYLVNAGQSTVKIVKLEQNSHNFEHFIFFVPSRCPNERTKIH